jgi:hypothetical protein
VNVVLTISGDDVIGYNLCISPTGYFSSDYWYGNIDLAYNAAIELFDVGKDRWHLIMK